MHYCNSDLKIKPYGLKKLHMGENMTECLLSKANCTFIHFRVSILIFKPVCVIWDLFLSAYETTSLYTVMTCHGISIHSETMKLLERRRKYEVEDTESSQKPYQNFRRSFLVTKYSRNYGPTSELMAQCKTHLWLVFPFTHTNVNQAVFPLNKYEREIVIVMMMNKKSGRKEDVWITWISSRVTLKEVKQN